MVLWLYLKKIHIEIFTHTISGSCFRIICEGKSWSDRNEIRLILIIFETRWWVHQFNSVQSLSGVQLFVTTWTAACQASLSITNCQSLLKLMSIESVMPCNHLILCHPLLLPPSILPASGSFQMSQSFISGGQSIGASASASVLPTNIQKWFPLGNHIWVYIMSI